MEISRNSPSQNSINTPSNQKFGWLFVAIFSVCFVYFQHKFSMVLATFFLLAAVVFAFLTICIPSALSFLNRAWFGLSLLLGKVVNPIVLSTIFFTLIVPTAIIIRLLGRDALSLKKRQVSSYWVDKELIDPESFKNQF